MFALTVEGVAAAGCPDKVAAHALGCPDQSYYSKCKSGDRPAPRSDKLTNLPEDAQRAICARWGRQLGMRVSTEDSRTRAIAELVEVAAKALREIA